MAKIEIINVGNGSNQYPGDFTKEENQIILRNCKGKVLHLFSGSSEIGDLRIDFTHKNATHKWDVFEFLEYNNLQDFNTIIIDAPYNKRFADKYQKIGNTPKQFIIFADTKRTTKLFYYINIINPEIIILKSWNYYCLKRYKIKSCYICYSGGFRKSTFLIIMKREQIILKEA